MCLGHSLKSSSFLAFFDTFVIVLLLAQIKKFSVWLSFRYRVEDWCTEGIFWMFQVKSINKFWSYFLTKTSFVRKKLTKNHEKVDFLGFYTIWLLNIIANYLLQCSQNRAFLGQKNQKHPQKQFFDYLKIWLFWHPKNLESIFFVQNFTLHRKKKSEKNFMVTVGQEIQFIPFAGFLIY